MACDTGDQNFLCRVMGPNSNSLFRHAFVWRSQHNLYHKIINQQPSWKKYLKFNKKKSFISIIVQEIFNMTVNQRDYMILKSMRGARSTKKNCERKAPIKITHDKNSKNHFIKCLNAWRRALFNTTLGEEGFFEREECFFNDTYMLIS